MAAHFFFSRTGVYTAVLGDYDVSDNNGDEQSVGIEEITLVCITIICLYEL